MRKNEFVRGIYFDSLSLRQLDDLATRWKRSRSQIVRLLVRKAASEDLQLGLPGLGSSTLEEGWRQRRG